MRRNRGSRATLLAALLGLTLPACDRSTSSQPPPVAAAATASRAVSAPLGAPSSPATSVAPVAEVPPPVPIASSAVPLHATPELLAARPYRLVVPPGLDPAKSYPLVLFLHGYGASGSVFESALGVGAIARSRQFIYAIPDGTPDSHKMKFWNATDACCDFDGKSLDDVAYLRAVLADAMSKQAIDRKRVFVLGYSNGGFMAQRLACELSDTIAGIASIAGAAWKDASKCTPSEPVTVLQVHGDADPIVRYEGGHVLDKIQMQPHPSARETVAGWASRDRCGATLLPGALLDLEDKLEGAETVTAHYAGCADSAVELWTVRGGNHFIAQKPRAIEAILAFLFGHPKR